MWQSIAPAGIAAAAPCDVRGRASPASVASVIAVVDLSKEYQILTKSYGGFLQIGLTTAVLYLVMSVPLGYLSRHLEKRWGAK